jgi:hypothetical protein
MAKVTVAFEVKPGDGARAYWIAVEDKDVPLRDGKGSIAVEGNQEHFLVWWFIGDAGSTLSIKGTQSGATVVEVTSTIPPGTTKGAGAKRFKTQ